MKSSCLGRKFPLAATPVRSNLLTGTVPHRPAVSNIPSLTREGRPRKIRQNDAAADSSCPVCFLSRFPGLPVQPVFCCTRGVDPLNLSRSGETGSPVESVLPVGVTVSEQIPALNQASSAEILASLSEQETHSRLSANGSGCFFSKAMASVSRCEESGLPVRQLLK